MSPSSILVVDDIAGNRELLTGLLTRDGYVVEVQSTGDAALDAIRHKAPDLVLMDIMMPGRSGIEICQLLKADPATRRIPIVLLTALSEREDKIRGISAGADDFLTKPVNAQELTARVRSLVRLKRYADDADSAESVILTLAHTIEARDPLTDGHCQRLAVSARALGLALDLPGDELAALHLGAFLHDIGQIAVPEAVLLKPGPLTQDEMTLVQRHSAVGDSLLADLRPLQAARPIVRHHHERLDGSGYPDRLTGGAIPFIAQIFAIVDVYDALTSERPFRQPWPPDRACAELLVEARQGWRNLDLVTVFVSLVQTGSLSTGVKTSTADQVAVPVA